MRTDILPPEFSDLNGKVNYVRERVRGSEWSSSCPNCGGEPHKGGELPDRFRMWVKNKGGFTFGWCRACGYKWTPRVDFKPDPKQVEEWRLERLAREERIKEEAEQAIKLLTDKHAWQYYYESLLDCNEAKDMWSQAGIVNPFWWGEWQLGYDPQHLFYFDTGSGWQEHTTPTLTIPERDMSGRIINIKHRLLNPFDGVKYRMEYKTGIEPVFISNLDDGKPAKDTKVNIICEGEKKAAVTFITLDMVNIQVYGLPKSPSDEMLKQIDGRVIQILDPDVSPSPRIAEIYNDRDYRIVRLPEKVDDWILSRGIEKEHLTAVLKQAERIS
jgi:hypothetical protein